MSHLLRRHDSISLLLRPAGFLACILVALLGCTEQTKQGSERTVVIGVLSDPKTLNPLSGTSVLALDITKRIFLKLADVRGDFLSFEPRLAESWTFDPDSLAITFTLRRDATWEDGVPVTAADVHYTWLLQTDTLVAWAGRKLKERIRDVQVVDDHTVRFIFTNRYPYQLMDANEGVILPKHLLEKIPRDSIRTADFGQHPVGNGPFRLSKWVHGQYIALERNPAYYEKGKPQLDRVVWRIVPDMTTLVTQLKSGEIDCLESIPMDALEDIEANHPEIRIHRFQSRGMTFIAWNLQNPIFADVEVRRALGFAVNGSEIIQTLWRGLAEPAAGPMPPILWAHDPSLEPLPFDPNRAIRMLNAAGWVDTDGDGILDKNGRAFEFSMTANQGAQVRIDVLTMVQAQLRRIGVRVKPQVLEWNAFIQQIVRGEFESCVMGWKVDERPDLTRFWRSDAAPPAGFNLARYSNPRVDQLIDEARNTTDTETARGLWYECQRIIYNDQPIYFLAVPYEILAVHERFCNVRPNGIGTFVNVRDWYVSDDCP